MKLLFILVFAIPFFANAQDSCLLKNEKDRYNQDPRLTTGFISLGAGNDKFLLSISADKKEVDYFFALDKSAMCFDDYSRVIVIYDTKQKGNFKNGGTTNCKGYFHFIFVNQPNLNPNLTNLSQKTIVSIQFTDTGSNKKIITLRPEDQQTIKKLTSCVIDQLDELRVDTWKPKQ
jgi:hypothetical protein